MTYFSLKSIIIFMIEKSKYLTVNNRPLQSIRNRAKTLSIAHNNNAKTLRLNSRVVVPEQLYKETIGNNVYVAYLPHKQGWPIIINSEASQLLDWCATEQQLHFSDLLTRFRSHFPRGAILDTVTRLYQMGFLETDVKKDKTYCVHMPSIHEIDSLAIWLHITNNCNLTCEYCFVNHKDNSSMPQEIANELIDKLIWTAKNTNVKTILLKFAGGEPTLNMNMIEYVYFEVKKRISELDKNIQLSFAIVSNGTIVNNRVISMLRHNDIGIGISLDGYGSKCHDHYRLFNNNTGSWNLINKNIAKLLACGIKPFILTTISPGNSSSLTYLIKWLIKSDLRTRLSVVRDHFLPEEHEIVQLIEDFEAMFSEIEKQEYDIDPRMLFTICELSFYKPRQAFSCGIGTSHLVVSHKGTVARCPMMVGQDTGRLENDLLQSIRSQLHYDPNDRHTTRCVSCKWFSVCVGGCPVGNEKEHGDPFALPSLHKFYEYVIPRFIRFFGIKLFQKVKTKGLDNCIIAKP